MSEAIFSNKIAIVARNIDGHYKGKTTALKVTNKTNKELDITVDLGAILKPDDSIYQPMVLAGGEHVTISPNGSREVQVMTFCGNSPKHCPAAGTVYTWSHMGNDALVRVLKFIKTHSLYNYYGQDAVWVITNGEDISSVNDVGNPNSAALVSLLCEVTGKPKPDVHKVLQHFETPGQSAYNPKPLKIIGNFTIALDSPKVLTLGIYNENGEMIQKVFVDQEFRRARHSFDVEFESADAPAGKYFLRLNEHDHVLQEKKVVLN